MYLFLITLLLHPRQLYMKLLGRLNSMIVQKRGLIHLRPFHPTHHTEIPKSRFHQHPHPHPRRRAAATSASSLSLRRCATSARRERAAWCTLPLAAAAITLRAQAGAAAAGAAAENSRVQVRQVRIEALEADTNNTNIATI